MARTRLSASLPWTRLATSINRSSGIQCLPRPSCHQLSGRASLSSCAGNSSAATTSPTCKIPKDQKFELFEYTTSRWLFNEKQRLSERRRVFNVAEFKALAAQSIQRKPEDVIRLEKLGEGGFYRVFRVTMRDGFEFIGRIPYPSTEPRHLIVASEVATMDFLRLQGLPVPKVFGYSATSSNAAGVEYIFMELVAGTCLRNVWTDDLPRKDKLAFVEEVVKLEAQISAMQFPASGSLYYSKDLDAKVRRIDVNTPNSIEVGKFCIGPDSDPSLWHGKRSELELDRGPYREAKAVLDCGAKKEIAYLKQSRRSVYPLPRMYREFSDYQKQTPDKHLELLDRYLKITPYLLPHDRRWARPTLRNPNLSADNIMVSRNLEITGLISWPISSIRPRFLQCGVPVLFEEQETSETPNDAAEMSEAGQINQPQLMPDLQLQKAYLATTEALNLEHFAAMAMPGSYLRRMLFSSASQPWFGDDFPLRLNLVRLQRSWHRFACHDPKTCETCLTNFTAAKEARYLEVLAKRAPANQDVEKEPDEIKLGAQKPCPFQFTDSEVDQCRKHFEGRRGIHQEFLDFAPYLGFNKFDGEILEVERYDEAKNRLALVKALTVGSAGEEDRKLVEEHWPFDDYDEDEYS